MANRRLRVPAHVTARQVAGSAVLFNARSGQYASLDEVGARVWALLGAPTDTATLCAALADGYDVEPDALGRDVDALVDQLAARGLVEIVTE